MKNSIDVGGFYDTKKNLANDDGNQQKLVIVSENQ